MVSCSLNYVLFYFRITPGFKRLIASLSEQKYLRRLVLALWLQCVTATRSSFSYVNGLNAGITDMTVMALTNTARDFELDKQVITNHRFYAIAMEQYF